ncbi:MAG: hypothetical protein ABIH23_19210, partial [bacterium]
RVMLITGWDIHVHLRQQEVLVPALVNAGELRVPELTLELLADDGRAVGRVVVKDEDLITERADGFQHTPNPALLIPHAKHSVDFWH